MILAWFLPLFLIFLMIGVPVYFAMLAAPGFMLYLNGQERDIALMYRNVFNGIDNGVLLAIPFFMLAGELMNRHNRTFSGVFSDHYWFGQRRPSTGKHSIFNAFCWYVRLSSG